VTALPLIERELRVRARSPVFYWTRFAVALMGLLFCLSMTTIFAGVRGIASATIGHLIFQGITGAAFLLSCCAGFLTVEGISRERREGTLWLMHLTSVKPLDILLGKFGATGLACLSALLAFVPVIMLPVLTGGVTGGEAFRTMLVLFDTMLLSLAAGLWASAGARGWFESARAAAILLLLLMVVVPVVPLPFLQFLSPSTAMIHAIDFQYRVAAAPYWWSLAAVDAISWFLLIAAGRKLRHTMTQAETITENVLPKRPRVRTTLKPPEEQEPAGTFTLVSWKIHFPKLGDSDPIRWLVRRQRGIKTVIWSGTLTWILTYWLPTLLMLLTRRGFTLIPLGLGQSLYLSSTILQSCLFAWAATRFFAEARRSGELEILLTTPVGAETVVASQWEEMKRLFGLPVFLLVLNNLVEGALYVAHLIFSHQAWSDFGMGLIAMASYCPVTVAETAACVWAGLWFGLSARSQPAAIVRVLLLCLGLPCVFELIGRPLLSYFISRALSNNFPLRPSYSFLADSRLAVSNVPLLLYYLGLIRWARRRLATGLTNPPESLSLPQTIARVRSTLARFVNKARHWPAPESTE